LTKSALILIDIQNDYFPGFEGSKMPLPNMGKASENAAHLLAAARRDGTTIIHIRHVMASADAPFFRPGTAGSEIHESVAPLACETVIQKARPNSFVGTTLENDLKVRQIEQITICGAMSQMCIDATARAAADLGFKVVVAEDACAAANVSFKGVNVPSELVHASIMAPLAASYADVRPTADCMASG
jgi:nicotinamidase-related amidase